MSLQVILIKKECKISLGLNIASEIFLTTSAHEHSIIELFGFPESDSTEGFQRT